jgi:hypothetical protein
MTTGTPCLRQSPDARGRDGGARQKLAAEARGACDTLAGRRIQNDSGLSQGLAGHFEGGSQTEAY